MIFTVALFQMVMMELLKKHEKYRKNIYKILLWIMVMLKISSS